MKGGRQVNFRSRKPITLLKISRHTNRLERSGLNLAKQMSSRRFLKLMTVKECFVLVGAMLTAQIYTQNIVFATQEVNKSSTKQEQNPIAFEAKY